MTAACVGDSTQAVLAMAGCIALLVAVVYAWTVAREKR